jgi:rRNA-processing protein FCF1
MAGVKGRSGTNKGKDKPFAEALRLEIADAGQDHKALRKVARALLDKAALGDVQACREVADRLDGKPTQAIEQTVEVTRYVVRTPDKALSTDKWQQQHVPTAH